MKTGRSRATTSEAHAVPHAPDKPKEDRFRHKNRVLIPTKRVKFSIFTEVYYMDASSKEQAERFDSDEDLDLFHDEPVLDLIVFHKQ